MEESRSTLGFKVTDSGKSKLVEIQESRSDEVRTRVFVSIWLFAWTIICAALVWAISVAEFHGLLILFSLPFLAGWFVGLFALLHLFYGSESIVIEPNQICIKRKLFCDYLPASISYKELVDIKIKVDEGDHSLAFESEKKTTGFPFHGVLKRETAESLVSLLKDEIPTLGNEE